LAHDLAMQVVAAKPLYMTKESVPAEALDEERAKYPAEVWDSGGLAKFYEENCLFEQPFIRNPSITICELVQQTNALLGENLVVRRFARFEVGG
jgi:elongation factor Ts